MNSEQIRQADDECEAIAQALVMERWSKWLHEASEGTAAKVPAQLMAQAMPKGMDSQVMRIAFMGFYAGFESGSDAAFSLMDVAMDDAT